MIKSFTCAAVLVFILGLAYAGAETGARDVPSAAGRAAVFETSAAGLGGYGGPEFKFTAVNGTVGLMSGAPLTLVLNKSVLLGAYGAYLDADADGLDMWYLGFRGGYLFFPDSIINFSIAGTLGAGEAVSLSPADGSTVRTGFFVVEPEIQGRLNITEYLALGLGATYRLAVPFNPESGMDMRILSGPGFFAALQYGVYEPSGKTDGARQRMFSSDKSGISFGGNWMQKFVLLKNGWQHFDGGYTRLVINRAFSVGPGGYVARNGVPMEKGEFTAFGAGVVVEKTFFADFPVHFSLWQFTGFGLQGYIPPGAAEPVGAPAILFEPELLITLRPVNFFRLSFGIGWRLPVPLPAFDDITFAATNGLSLAFHLRNGRY